jgi:hypothetical protein
LYTSTSAHTSVFICLLNNLIPPGDQLPQSLTYLTEDAHYT